jgi:hypothetical protein
MRPFSLPGEGQDEGIENHDAVRTSPHPTIFANILGMLLQHPPQEEGESA